MATSGGREAVGKRMGINEIKTGEREIVYVNSRCPPTERERNMLGCLLPFQKHIGMKVHKLFLKKQHLPNRRGGGGGGGGEKRRRHQLEGKWKIF